MKKMMMNWKKIIAESCLVVFLAFGTMLLFASVNHSDWIGLRIGSANVTAYLEHETSGVLNLATSTSNIGDLRPTGVTKTMYIPAQRDTLTQPGLADVAAFKTQWIAQADSDNGVRLMGDAILDSISYFATPTGTDSIISRVYKTTATATSISGPDTLVFSAAGWQTVDLTGVAAATRDLDMSAGEYPAFQATEVGTLANVGVVIHFREYDAQ